MLAVSTDDAGGDDANEATLSVVVRVNTEQGSRLVDVFQHSAARLHFRGGRWIARLHRAASGSDRQGCLRDQNMLQRVSKNVQTLARDTAPSCKHEFW